MTEPALPLALGWCAAILGVVGASALAVRAKKGGGRWGIVLLGSLAVAAAGGGLQLAGLADDLGCGAWPPVAGLLGCAVSAVALALRSRDTEVAAALAQRAAEEAQRESETLLASRVRLEAEVAKLRAQIEERRSETLERGSDTTDGAPEERLERYQERLARLRAVEGKLRQIIDGGRDGISILERETLRLERFTPSLLRLLGHEPEELAQLGILDVLEKGPAEPGRADLQRVAHERRPLAAKLVRKDGTRVPVEITVVPVGQGSEAQLMVVVRDVSEQAELRRELDALRRELAEREVRLAAADEERHEAARRLDDASRRLAALRASREQAVEAFAHDLRVPLTSIRSFSEIMLRHEDAGPAVQREFLEIIKRESERLTGLIDELLDVRRIGAGEGRARFEEIDIVAVLGETVATVSGLALSRGVRFEGTWDRSPRVIRGERARLRRMLESLLTNAVSFGGEGASVELFLRDGRTPGATLLGIREHGPATGEVDEDDIVFERFHRGSTGPDAAPGTGPGLSIAREIAAAHGARVWPESRPGGGTTLWVEFPAPDEVAGTTEGALAGVADGASAVV